MKKTKTKTSKKTTHTARTAVQRGYVVAVRRQVRIADLHRDDPEARLHEPRPYPGRVPDVDASSLPPVLVLDGWDGDGKDRFFDCPSVPAHAMLLLDGNHRVGSAEARGEKTIDAWVVQWNELRAVWSGGEDVDRYAAVPYYYDRMDYLIRCGSSKASARYDREGSKSC